jgi:uncharacterized protein (TIGR03435 family)
MDYLKSRKAAFTLAVLSLDFRLCAQLPRVEEFEAASVKPHKETSTASDLTFQFTPGGRLRLSAFTPSTLIGLAYGLREGELTGAPNWMNTEHYDLEAKLDDSLGQNSEFEQVLPCLQTLLEQRFQLRFHRQTRERQGYALTVAKSGPHLKASDPATTVRQSRWEGDGHLTIIKMNMDGFAGQLAGYVKMRVLNQTGLKGDYDLELKWAPEGSAGDGGPTLFTALQEQIGLRLESRKMPVELLVIDHVERPSEN